MATQATGGGSTVSFGNTPQANTDIFSFAEDASNILILNVLANDLGGAAKTLFSLDDGMSSSASTKNYAPADLLVKDVAYSSDAAGMAATGDRSALGARIWIEADGTVHYDKGDINVQLQALATGQTLTDTFTYAIQLGNGTLSWATVTLQFNGANDSVFITSSPQSGSVVEDANATPDFSDSQSAAGTISFNDADLNDTHSASFAAASSNTTSLGTFSLDPVNEAPNAANGAVQWHYNLNNAAAQYLAAGQTVAESFVVTINDGHGSTATQTVTVTITGTNDIVSITSGVQSGAVVEDAPSTPSLSDSLATAGSISFNDVDLSDGHTATFVAGAGNTTALGTFSLDPVSEAANAANGSVQWHYALNSAAAQYLAEGQSVTESFVVTINDGHGSTATQTVTVTTTGTNDIVSITSGVQSGSVVEDAPATPDPSDSLTTAGTISFTDVDLSDGHTATFVAAPANTSALGTFSLDTVSEGANTASGSVQWHYNLNNAAAQYLAAGQSVVEHYAVTVSDGQGSTVTQDVAITIAGANDVVSVTSGVQAGTVVEDAPATPDPSDSLTAAGTVSFTDVDLSDGHTATFVVAPANTTALGTFSLGPVSEAANAANGSVQWHYNLDNVAAQHLAAGQSVTESFVVTVNDGHGSTATQTVTITLTGTNDTPVAVADTNSGLEDSTITGSVATNDSDVDDGATLTYAQTSAVAGLTINADGSYSFEASNAAYQHLAEGATQVVVANYTVTDEHGASAPSTLTITLTGTNDTPVAVADTNSGLEDSTITGSVATNDSDVDDGATLTYAQTSAVAGLTINADGSYSFEASNAAYQHLAEGATQVVVANYTVTDEHGASAPSTLTITLTGTNDTPVAVAGHTLNYTENHAATAIDPALTVSDVDNANLVSATVQITGNYVNGQDVLGFTNQNGITGSFNAATGTLTLTGSSSVANYQTALDSVTYFNTSDNPSGLARTVTIITNDGAANSVAVTDTINVTPVNDAPVLNANGGTLSYTENQAATAIDTVLTASDVDSTNLTGATVSITTNFASGQDVLGFTNQNGITGSYNAGTGVLTLTGSATVANYQAALRSVTYSSSSDNPSGATRTISYQVDDGAGANHASNIATSTVAVTPVNDAPVLNANGGTLSYTENQAATAIDTVLTASDVDSTNLTGATVSITTNFASGQDVLGFTNQNGITGSYNAGTGVLTLTGSATVANYQAALRSVTYSNSSDNPSGATRTISYQVDDGAGANHASNIATSTVAVTPVNDAPVAQNDAYILDTSGGNILTVTTPGVLTNDSDPDSAITAVKDTNPTHGTVTLNPNGSFTYTRTDSFLGTDSFTYHTSDGSLSSNPVTVTITLAGSVSGHVINFGNGTDIANFANNTFDGNTPAPSGNWSVLMGNGGDTLVTAWNHINGTTTYNGGNGADDITLVFSSTQLEQVLSNATFEGALQNYFNGSPTGTLDLLASSWQASATAFENGNLALALNGGGAATYSAIADDLPNLLAGLTGNPSDNTLVGTANGETISGNDGNDIVVGLGGDDTLNGGNGSDLLLGGSGNDTLTGGAGIDILSGGTGNNTFRYTAVTDSNHAGFDIVTDFASGSDKIAATSGLAITSIGTSLATATSSVAAHTFAWFVDTANNQTIVYGNATNGALNGGTASLLEIHLAGVTSLTATDFATGVAPAGIAGEQINLGLTDPSSDLNDLITVTVSGVPLGWSLNAGTNEGNGTWTVQTNDVRSLAVTTLTDFAGAVVLNVAETWTEADGSTGTRVVFDNIEAYAAGSPIFAISGDDNLTASSGNDLLVFAQPIGRDTIYNFDTAHDQIDLVGYAEFTGFGDIQAHTANDSNGNAVISAGEGQSITLHGVDASSLTASDFIFDQTPVTENAGHMVIADGAILPLSGIIDNTGTIELNSSGSETDLELIEHGITLQGHGQVILSDSSENVITGTVSDVTLTNVDNTISGAGHLGDGMMVLVNEGTIIATGTNALDIDTGANAVTNTGTIEATGTGGLEVHSDLVNTGVLWANGGNVTIDGNVSGNGTAQISGSATLEFGAASSAHVTLDAQATGTIVLHDSFDFSGVVSGFNGDDHLDLLDVAFGAGTTASYVANQAGAGGTLSVTDGVHTANITLLGQYDPAGFQTEADKNTGTLISYHDHLA
ncbi:VCBS domain-containing protein [Bradyrhizobium sp. 193]|uniref:VCBS domain-containing protein n=1 Tax=unclassified Bradyrhizobium TaxID=2631580 RepID=UPI001FF97DF2|nr:MULTISPECIES: VCBS domain-containing protein [unclassified Bradyrhizobium]MCK1467490.1 VCBS domain-containing protein [Bradyrhizobium sp. CW10]MCK1482288.1 VCBS domain-containing protein [Bradyrhizobium sp. 193]MCK1700906.1 VCBS domain-containing protein [Bradyrhizobium sp. 146]